MSKQVHVFDCVRTDPHFTTIRKNGRRLPKRGFQNLYIRLIGLSKFGKSTVYISYDTLAAQSTVSTRSAIDFVEALVTIGYLKIVTRGGQKGRFWDCNRYKVTMPASYQAVHAAYLAAQNIAAPEKEKPTDAQRLMMTRALMLKVPGATDESVNAYFDKCFMQRANEDAIAFAKTGHEFDILGVQ